MEFTFINYDKNQLNALIKICCPDLGRAVQNECTLFKQENLSQVLTVLSMEPQSYDYNK